MKAFILSLFFAVLSFAQVDSMEVNWVDPTATDLDSIRIYADTTASPTTWRGSVAEATESFKWLPPYAGLWRVRVRAMDDSTNLSAYSLIDTVTINGSTSAEYKTGAEYVWDHKTETNNAELLSWEDSTTNLAIYVATDYAPDNVDSGVVWGAADQYLRQVASFPAGLFDGALTIEMVVKVVRTDSTQNFFWARNASNEAIGIGIGATGIFAGGIYDLTGGYDYTHNSSATTGWHYLVYTWNGTTTRAFYVDGVVQTDVGDANQYEMFSGDNRLGMGATGSMLPLASGTLVPFIVLRKGALTAQEVEDNFNSPVIQSHIPAWAR